MRFTLTLLASIALASPAARAEETGGLTIELNRQEPAGADCRLTFVVTNRHATPIDGAVFETVLFDAQGSVDRLTLFDFGALPQGRERVRQFQVDGLACDNLGRVLFNGASSCTAGGQPSDLCANTLEVSSRTATELLR